MKRTENTTSALSNLAKRRTVIFSSPQKCPLLWRDSIHVCMYLHESALTPFSHFCTVHPGAERHRDHTMRDSCSNRPHLCTVCRRCGLLRTSISALKFLSHLNSLSMPTVTVSSAVVDGYAEMCSKEVPSVHPSAIYFA